MVYKQYLKRGWLDYQFNLTCKHNLFEYKENTNLSMIHET